MPVRKSTIDNLDANGQSLRGVNCTLATERVFDLDGATAFSVQFNPVSIITPSAYSVWTVEVSTDGVRFAAPSPAVSDVTISGSPGITPTIDATTIRYARVRNSTLSTAATEVINIVLLRADW